MRYTGELTVRVSSDVPGSIESALDRLSKVIRVEQAKATLPADVRISTSRSGIRPQKHRD